MLVRVGMSFIFVRGVYVSGIYIDKMCVGHLYMQGM